MKIRSRINRVKNLLGLPVDYTRQEFQDFKAQLDWSKMDDYRVRVLSELFGEKPQTIEALVDEARNLPLNQQGSDANQIETTTGRPMGETDRITLYVAIRLYKPKTIVETGTGRGGAATTILAAIEKNAIGKLISIDQNPERDLVGDLIPEHNRKNLTLVQGDSLAVLPLLRIAELDCFVHDSTHTSAVMKSEFEFACEHFDRKGLLCSHDILKTNVWSLFQRQQPSSRAIQVKNLGIMLYRRSPTFKIPRILRSSRVKKLVKLLIDFLTLSQRGPRLLHRLAITQERLSVNRWQRENMGSNFSDYYFTKQARAVESGAPHPTLGHNLTRNRRKVEAGTAFFELLVEQGLKPHHTCVDFGCGSLRVGQHLIPYLNASKYVGLDVRETFYSEALTSLDPTMLSIQQPHTARISRESLRKVALQKPEFIFANAVLIHVPPDELPIFFARLRYLSTSKTKVIIHGRVSHRRCQYSPESWSHSRRHLENLVKHKGGEIEYLRAKPFTKYSHVVRETIETVVIKLAFS